MNKVSFTLPAELYHSYVIEGDPAVTSQGLLAYLTETHVIAAGNEDILVQLHDSFAIADGIPVHEWHARKKVTDKKKVCIIGAKFMNREAEQSLLKILEEPKEDSHIFLVVPNASVLASTILSRVHVVKSGHVSISHDVQASEFIASSIKDRLSIVASLIDDAKDDETSGGLRYSAQSLLSALEKKLYIQFKKDITNTHCIFVLGELQMARMYVATPGASVKMILEHIACVL